MKRMLRKSGKGRDCITTIYDISGGIAPTSVAGGFSRLKNMYLDPESRMLTSFVGFRKIHSFDGKIHAILSADAEGEERIFVHSGENLYSFSVSERDKVKNPASLTHLADRESSFCVRGNTAFITDGERLLMIKDGTAVELSRDLKLTGARCLAIYDGRLALSGNPIYPDRILISEPICDGEVVFYEDSYLPSPGYGAEVLSLLALGEELWVFLSRDVGDGSILCYKKGEGGKYRICDRIFSLRPLGSAVSFKDEILFLTTEGLFAIRRGVGGRIEIIPRSKGIYPKLAGLPLSEGKISLFGRYVLLFFGKRMYLGDRDDTSDGGYSWYPLDDVGSYVGDKRIYRYSTESIDGFQNAKDSDRIADGEIFSLRDEGGRMIYYERLGGKRLLVYPTEIFFGGDFFPATRLYCKNELIWFSTDAGDLCLFNTDRCAEADEEKNENWIYTFCRHAVEYIAEFAPDDGGFPNMEKDTLPHSMILGAEVLGKAETEISVKADGEEVYRGEIRLGRLDFSKIDFENFSTSPSAVGRQIIPERAHRWREKQVLIRSIGYGSPIRIASLSHTFRLREKNKKAR